MNKELICELVSGFFEEFLDKATQLISGVLFKDNAMPSFFKTVYGIFLGIACALMICIILFKVTQYLLDVSNGMQQTTLGEIITRTIKSSVMILIAPFILNISLNYVVYPVGQYAFAQINNSVDEQTEDVKEATMKFASNVANLGNEEDKGIIDTVKDYAGMKKNNYIFVFMLGFITVTLVAYFFKMCIFQADVIWLNILSIKAAISMCADDNNYMGVWWREMLSQVTSIIVQTFSIVGVVKLMRSDFSWYNLMLMVGMSIIVLRGPAVLRHMWYATGTGKSLMAASKVAARKFLKI